MSAISILIVEDEAVTAMYMKKIFIHRGYDVVGCVATGEEAVNSANILMPDLVLLDIRLAGRMDGIETAALIKQVCGDKIQLVFVTGYSELELVDRAMELGPLHFFLKPLNLSEFIKIVESYFTFTVNR